MAAAASVVGADNPTQILRAAEALFAEHGIDGVSLREINRAAGQGNASAVQYHFGDREGLLMAVLARHQGDTDPRRHRLLDEYEAGGASDLRALAAALVIPLADKLTDPDGGRAYLRVACEFYTRARSLADLGKNRDPGHSMARWHRLVEARLPDQEDTLLPSRYPAVRLALAELARRAEERPRRDYRLFTSYLTDLVTAVLATTASKETAELLAERERRRQARKVTRRS